MVQIIAFSGLCGTGKTLGANYLRNKYHMDLIYLGRYVLEHAKTNGIEINARNERTISKGLRSTLGMSAMAQLASPDIKSLLTEGKSLVIDGLYSFAELEYFRTNIEVPFTCIALHSSKDVRVNRLSSRKSRPLTNKEIEKRDIHEIDNLGKSKTIIFANYHIVNDGTEFEFYSDIKKILTKLPY